MTRAVELAQESLEDGDLPVGVVAVLNGEIIGEGRRSPIHNTRLDHGEMLALRAVAESLGEIPRGITIYSTLEPCFQCAGGLMNARASRVLYALEDPYGGACEFLERVAHLLPPRHQEDHLTSEAGLLREEVKVLFREFFSTTQNKYWTSHPENPLFRLAMD